MPICEVCHNHCNLNEGKLGLCRARVCKDGEISCANYGIVTSLSLDPIAKKPLNRFHPGSWILSIGSYGCNLRCPFCQNHEISYGYEMVTDQDENYNNILRPNIPLRITTPEELVELALSCRDRGNIGLAFTYNEPLVGYEFVRDTAKLAHENGLLNVLVSNGNASVNVCHEILPYIDAMNIDLKGFTDSYYTDILKGDRQMVMDFIAEASQDCHMEVTTLVVPGYNDLDEEIKNIAEWISSLSGPQSGVNIPLHISRYFPRFHMTDVPATDVDLIYHLADVARMHLKYVYTGNC